MAERAPTQSVQAEQRFEARSSERFNRIAYAIELLRQLNPPLTVAVYGTRRRQRLAALQGAVTSYENVGVGS